MTHYIAIFIEDCLGERRGENIWEALPVEFCLTTSVITHQGGEFVRQPSVLHF